MQRRQLLRGVGATATLPLLGTATAIQDGEETQDGEACDRPECIHPRLGYTVFAAEDVEALPDDLQPAHTVSLEIELPEMAGQATDGGDGEPAGDDSDAASVDDSGAASGDDSDSSDGDQPAGAQAFPEFYFDPVGLAVESGDVVAFELASPDHTVTAFHEDLGRQRRVPEGVEAFSSPVLAAGDVWLYRFEEPGVYDVLCSPHEIFGMAMRIVVDEPEADFGEVGPERRGPVLTAATVLDDDALDPANVDEQGEVGWDELDEGSKEILVELPEPDESGDGPQDGESDDGDDGDAADGRDDGGDTGGSDDADDGDGGDVVEQDGLRITEHELVEGDFTTAVEGILVNESGSTVDFVEVAVTFYDADGVRIDEGFDVTTDLEDGEEWAFEASAVEDADEIDDYEIAIED